MIIPTVNIKKILYATDLSPAAQYAFAHAKCMAEAHGATLTLLHVINAQPRLNSKILGYITSEDLEGIRRDHEADARSVLVGKLGGGTIRKALDRLGAETRQALEQGDVRADEILVERGNPVEEILNQAEHGNFDMIVMGTHGQGALERVMMGSTARRVLRRSKIPVLVVRLPEEDGTDSTVTVVE